MAPTMRRCLCAAAVVAALVRGASAADGIRAAAGGARAHGALEQPGDEGNEFAQLGKRLMETYPTGTPQEGDNPGVGQDPIKKIKPITASTVDTQGDGQPTIPPPDANVRLEGADTGESDSGTADTGRSGYASDTDRVSDRASGTADTDSDSVYFTPPARRPPKNLNRRRNGPTTRWPLTST